MLTETKWNNSFEALPESVFKNEASFRDKEFILTGATKQGPAHHRGNCRASAGMGRLARYNVFTDLTMQNRNEQHHLNSYVVNTTLA